MLKSTNQPLSEAYSLALLDLDGVVYRGKNPVEHAAKNIRKAESLGMTVEYTTNNSSRLQAVVADQLKGFDLDVESWRVITSSVVAARMVHVPCLKVRRFSCLAPSICVRKWPSKVLKSSIPQKRSRSPPSKDGIPTCLGTKWPKSPMPLSMARPIS